MTFMRSKYLSLKFILSHLPAAQQLKLKRKCTRQTAEWKLNISQHKANVIIKYLNPLWI